MSGGRFSRFVAFPSMAKSRYEYVRSFELNDATVSGCWLVVRVDGCGFTKWTKAHHYTKPNDMRGIGVMTDAARSVCQKWPDIVLAYGQSDEFSFVLQPSSQLYKRRASKLISVIVSHFTACFVMSWEKHWGDVRMQSVPCFDARVVAYPTDRCCRDYVSWRQVDCHINNLYNTCFWALVQHGDLSEHEAHVRLNGTSSAQKNELLFADFGINYAQEPEVFRKGTTFCREFEEKKGIDPRTGNVHVSRRKCLRQLTCDLIGDSFWLDRPWLLHHEAAAAVPLPATEAQAAEPPDDHVARDDTAE